MLYTLMKTNPKIRKAIIKYGDTELINTLSEIALNVLNGNSKINNKTKKNLLHYKKQIRCIACSKRSVQSKRRILIQKGGFLPILIGGILSGIIGSLLDNNGK